jgi:hypothetical protein
MPKRLDQMTILERADAKYEHFCEIQVIRQKREKFRRIFDYGTFIISFSLAIISLFLR